jgi:uncharacterized protein (TIGR03437 family)
MAAVDGVNAPVGFAGLAPGYVGLYQVNVTVPITGVKGLAPFVLVVAGASTASQNGMIAVQ